MQNNNGLLSWNYSPAFGKCTGYESILDTLNIYDVEEFNKLSLPDQIDKAHEVLALIRKVNLFPVYYYTEQAVLLDILNCIYEDAVFVGNTLDVNSPTGNTLLDFMFPGIHLTNAGGSRHNSMYDRFFDDDKLTRCLVGYMKKYQFGSVRTMFFMYGRLYWQTATGFTPMRAKAIYERFCKPGYTVYDSSAGFGGRMLGAMSSTMDLKYIACEPCTTTFNSLNVLGEKINLARSKFDLPTLEYHVHHCGSEDFEVPAETIDFAFTCPPYFRLERYSDEPTQSTIKFPKYQQWLDGFVKPTIQHTYAGLKRGASMCTVLGNVRDTNNKRYALIDDWITCAEAIGFKYISSFNIKTRSRKDPDDLERILYFIKE